MTEPNFIRHFDRFVEAHEQTAAACRTPSEGTMLLEAAQEIFSRALASTATTVAMNNRASDEECEHFIRAFMMETEVTIMNMHREALEGLRNKRAMN